ncbi:uncharacterized protein E0L32_002819 [Thyridium curvatum]|uniref:F-box domain-containing protein n=1 Tax=Thyridium curvatum TaxID=1093900 RepID=A0A507BLY1_9PEZI|nr:uncharacterized protein E0L32_002819 [Thyridium curvatum]TPX17718.1 hypothetical protein E0L32_002819 [Thyridium curvatum]
MGLTDLPTELVDLVCRQLCPHCNGDSYDGHVALAQLARTCQALSKTTQSVLFHRICVCRTYISCIETLIKRSDLRSQVRQIRYVQGVGLERSEDAPEVKYYNPDEDGLQDFLSKESMAFFNAAGLQKWTESEFYEESTASLFVLAPNADKIYFRDWWKDGELPALFSRKRPRLPALKVLELEYDIRQDLDYDLAEISCLLRAAPNLIALRLGDYHEMSGFNAHLPNVVELSLYRCYLPQDSVKMLVHACPVLREFVYHSRDWPYPLEEDLGPQDIAEVLLERRKRLTRIEMDFTEAQTFDAQVADLRTSYDFKKFTALKELALDGPALFNHRYNDLPGTTFADRDLLIDMLPPQIESLDIYSGSEVEKAGIRKLIDRLVDERRRFPKLELVRQDCKVVYGDRGAAERHRVPFVYNWGWKIEPWESVLS